MKNILMLIGILVPAILLSGCNADGDRSTSNGQLIVYNETNQTIEVQYTRETNSGFADETEWIDANSQGVMYVYALWYDAEVVVIYNGISREYDLDFRLTETAELYVHKEDF
ncbi:MAG: hypothetical protein ABIK15_03820 [Pseudomonadota bacterium]